jgi:peptidoglycan/xylan/chitin deacetylase (PgdA/CDA1 family)
LIVTAGRIFLMYHEIESSGKMLCQSEPGYVRYVLKESEFRSQLARIGAHRLAGLSVGEALDKANYDRPGVVITFDDGCETDLLIAAPLLLAAGLGATFYVVAGFIGRRGYLSEGQLRQLCGLGFELGCHSMTHAYLSDLSHDHLRVEVEEAKDRLEQIAGTRVDHFSCPGGRWNRRLARMAQEAGYLSVATSRIGANSPSANSFNLARIAMMRDISPAEFDRICRGEGFFSRRARSAVLAAAKSLLGNSVYERVRSTVLGQ